MILRFLAVLLVLFPLLAAGGLPPKPEGAPTLYPIDAQAGGRWIGEFEAIPGLGRDRPLPARAKSEYRTDPRVKAMMADNLRRQQERWHTFEFTDGDAEPLGELGLRFLHHGPEQTAPHQTLDASAKSKSTQTVRVLLRRASDGSPVGNLWVFNASNRQFQQVSNSGELDFEAATGSTTWLHVPAPAPVAMGRVAIEVVAGQDNYTVDMPDGEAVEVRFVPREGQLGSGFFAYYSIDGQSNFARWVDGSGVDRLALAPGAQATVQPQPALPHFFEPGVFNLGTRRGEVILPLERGAILSLELGGSGQATVLRERSRRWFHSVGGTSPLRLLVPKNEAVRIDIQPPAPFLPTSLRSQRFEGDQTVRPELERGVPITIDLRDADGQTRSMNVTVNAADGYHSLQNAVASGSSISVPAGRDLVIQASLSNGLPVEHRGRFDQAATLVMQARAESDLRGQVRNAVGSPLPGVRVQARQAGQVVASDVSSSEGRYQLRLPLGDYQLVAFFEGVNAPVAPPLRQALSLRERSQEQDLLLERPTTSLRIAPPSGAGCLSLQQTRAQLRIVAPGEEPMYRLSWYRSGGGSDPLLIEPGRYRVEVEVPGYPGWTKEDLEVGTTDLLLGFDATPEQCRRWTGTLRDAQGRPVSHRPIRISNAAQEPVGAGLLDGTGRFSLPIAAGLVYDFPSPEGGESLRKVHRIETPRESFEQDVRLEALQFAGSPRPQPGRQLIYGDADDPRRFDIVFVAEGYVAQQETFTDRNGNGQWDGVLFADLNRNGVWDLNEPFSVYGNAAWPTSDQAGRDIRVDNEPFEDLNGDGYPNLDDPAVFGQNIRNFMRELLSLPFWEERRDAFNAWALWYDSEQAGMDLIDTDGSVIQERHTAFGARWLRDRSLLAVDYARVEAALGQDMPHHGLRVVLMNQPVAMGRANAFILYYGGIPGASPNSQVASHELGHALGLLADEYQEFRGNFVGAEPVTPNLTRLVEPDLPRWPITAAGHGPHPHGMPGTGWFDGGGYYQGGLYRPTHQSTMRGNSVLFNAPSLASLEKEACLRFGSCDKAPALRSGVWWHPDEPGWGLFVFDQGDVLATAWFTYDEAGEPTWFLLPGVPVGAGHYRADVLRFTGTPLDSIQGNADTGNSRIGEADLQFGADNRLQFGYRIGDLDQAKSLQPFPFGGQPVSCRASEAPSRADAANLSDVWWNPTESGWGLFLNHRGDQLFAAWYTYDSDGRALFLVASAGRDANGFEGPIFRQQTGTPFTRIDGQPASPGADEIGRARFDFSDGESGVFRYRIGEVEQNRPITRLQVGSAVSRCSAE